MFTTVVLLVASVSASSTTERVVSSTKTSKHVEVPTRLRTMLAVEGGRVDLTVLRERQCFREDEFIDEVVVYEHREWAFPTALVLGGVGTVVAAAGGGLLFFPPQPTEVEVIDPSGDVRTSIEVDEVAQRQHLGLVVGGIASGALLAAVGGLVLLIEDVPQDRASRVRLTRSQVPCNDVRVDGVEVLFTAGSTTVSRRTDARGQARWSVEDAPGFFQVVRARINDENAGPEDSGKLAAAVFFPRLGQAVSSADFDVFRTVFPAAQVPDALLTHAKQLREREAAEVAKTAEDLAEKAEEHERDLAVKREAEDRQAAALEAERAVIAKKWKVVRTRGLTEVETYVDEVGEDRVPPEAVAVLGRLRVQRQMQLAKRYSFKGIALGMNRSEVEKVRTLTRCEPYPGLEVYLRCFVPAEDDESEVAVWLDGDVVISISVAYDRGMDANHDAFAKLLTEKFGQRAKRDQVVLGEYRAAEVHDRSTFVRGGDRAVMTSYSVDALFAGAPDLPARFGAPPSPEFLASGFKFHLLLHDDARWARFNKRDDIAQRAAETADGAAKVRRMKF